VKTCIGIVAALALAACGGAAGDGPGVDRGSASGPGSGGSGGGSGGGGSGGQGGGAIPPVELGVEVGWWKHLGSPESDEVHAVAFDPQDMLIVYTTLSP
jgi:hypothetical protein